MRALALLCLLSACGSMTVADAGVRDAGGAGGGSGGGGAAGGSSVGGGTAGVFCARCIGSADCVMGSLCLGGVQPRCGENCASSGTCPAGLTCTTLSSGKMPLGQSCIPSDAACGGAYDRTGLSCTDTWANYGSSFITTNCIGACHRHDTSWMTASDVRAGADGFRIAVERGTMPPDATLTAAERRRLLVWLACGAP